MKSMAGTLLGLLVILVIAPGCDGGTNPNSVSASTSVIYRGNGGDPGSLDPALAEDIHAFNILTDLYEGLVAESAIGELVPGVVESWTISDDGLTYTFSLRNDARWSNGDPVTPHDFVNAFRRVANPTTASVYGFLLEPILRFTEVQDGSLSADQLAVSAVDDLVLEIRLREPTTHMLAVLAMPVAFPVHRSAVAYNRLSVASMWRDALGVEVTLEKMEWQYFLETRNRKSDWQVMRFVWFGDYNHASTFTNIFRSNDPQNLSDYRNPEYDQLLVSAASESDDASRGALIAKAESIMLEDHPIAPLYFFVSKHLVRPDIAGFENNVLDRHPSKYLATTRAD
jgi:ABC-type oligopeptide transport system substrate-binding subunit